MATVLTQLFLFTGIYAVICIGTIFLMNFLTQGFFGTWFRVKASRGKRVLGICHGANRIFFRACEVSGKKITYTDQLKEKVTITNIVPGMFYNGWGLMCIDIDDINDSVWIRPQGKIAGGDVRVTDALIERAMMTNGQRKDIIQVLIIGLIVIFIGVCIAAYFSYHADLVCGIAQTSLNSTTVIK